MMAEHNRPGLSTFIFEVAGKSLGRPGNEGSVAISEDSSLLMREWTGCPGAVQLDRMALSHTPLTSNTASLVDFRDENTLVHMLAQRAAPP